MKLTSARYLTKEGFRNIWANRLMSIASIGVLSACMLILGVAFILSLNVDKALNGLEKQNVALVYFDPLYGESASQKATAKIAALDNVNSAVFVSKDEGLDSMKDVIGDENSLLFDALDEDNPLPNSAKVTFNDLSKMSDTLSEIEQVAGVSSIRSNSDVAEKITTIRSTVTMASAWIVVLLLIISLVIISNTVRITMYSRKLEISIMKAVGATDSFIRFPFLIEGVILGLIASGFTTGLLYAVYSMIRSNSNLEFADTLIPFREFVWPMFGAFCVIGVVVGLVGSSIIITKYLRKEGSEFRAL